MTHCLGLGHETMVCAVCLSIFFLRRLISEGHSLHVSNPKHLSYCVSLSFVNIIIDDPLANVALYLAKHNVRIAA